ncbi:MAG TPA: rod shape-determining protein MreD [Treponema sp.]|nr:rod shape-determining protein MreD [Treponema sp.]
MTKSYVTSIVIIFCTVLIETAILSNISVLPAVPDLLLLCTLYIGILNGKAAGEIAGFTSGVFLDFLSGAPFGFNCLYRTVLGFISGLLGISFNFEGILMPAVVGFSGTFIKVFFVWIISLLYPNVSVLYHVASVPFLFELACNTVLAPLVFKFLSLFKSSLSLKPEDD